MTWAGLRVHGQSLWYQAIIAAASRRATNPGLEYVGTERLLLALPDDAHAERPSDELSDNRHRQRWTPADTHGRSAAGHACCSAGSTRRNLASGRRGRRFKSGHPDPGQSAGFPFRGTGFSCIRAPDVRHETENVRHHGRPDAAARLPHDSITLSCASGAR